MDEHPNARLARGLFEASRARDLAAIRAATLDDAFAA